MQHDAIVEGSRVADFRGQDIQRRTGDEIVILQNQVGHQREQGIVGEIGIDALAIKIAAAGVEQEEVGVVVEIGVHFHFQSHEFVLRCDPFAAGRHSEKDPGLFQIAGPGVVTRDAGGEQIPGGVAAVEVKEAQFENRGQRLRMLGRSPGRQGHGCGGASGYANGGGGHAVGGIGSGRQMPGQMQLLGGIGEPDLSTDLVEVVANFVADSGAGGGIRLNHQMGRIEIQPDSNLGGTASGDRDGIGQRGQRDPGIGERLTHTDLERDRKGALVHDPEVPGHADGIEGFERSERQGDIALTGFRPDQ